MDMDNSSPVSATFDAALEAALARSLDELVKRAGRPTVSGLFGLPESP